MDEIFGIYSARAADGAGVGRRAVPGRPRGESPQAHARAIKAKALDLLRGLLPAASLSHMGIFATGQTYEQLILHLLAHPLPEARHYGRGILEAVQAVMPSFVSRVERPDRGGEWVAYLRRREQAAERWVARLGLDRAAGDDGAGGPSVRLVHHDGDEDLMLAALLFEASATDERATRAALARARRRRAAARCSPTSWAARANRRHRPGRGLEALRYRFEIVSDYGAFRDLQRHRMLTCQWQALTPDLGAGVPARARRRRRGRRLPPRARRLAARLRAAARRRPRPPRGDVRAVPRLPPALRARPQRARGDAAHRAALRPRGPSRPTARSRTRCTSTSPPSIRRWRRR